MMLISCHLISQKLASSPSTLLQFSTLDIYLELAMERIWKQDWANAVAHVIKEKEKMWILDGIVNTVFDQIIIDLSVTGDSSSDESMDSETS
ncbi:uncharacterized protein [Leptinotarsa decemlineata]|uniref:uncharacterized protein n=1 Tax=Leptinotarsa decemlineata TaxID=7539 RepID=UPI003D3065CE